MVLHPLGLFLLASFSCGSCQTVAYLPSTESKRSRYRILGLVGQGQFGQVFCAVHRQTGRLVALKNLEQARFSTHQFLRELRFLLSLQHPNIVTCQSLEHTATGRYLVMDYCEGGTLRTLMTEDSRLNLSQSLKLVMDVLSGLDHAHSRGIVHCDIKPENILLHVHRAGWTARISDFGIARLLQEVVQREGDTGSPAYMAPERFYGQYSAASDLYSIGILLFELIAGYRPFSGTPAELRSAHLNAPLQLPASIPSPWQTIIAQALQKLPARRFRSAGEMLRAMRAVVQSEPSYREAQSPLFVCLAAALECPFQPLRQVSLPHSIGAIAAQQLPSTQADPLEAAYQLYGLIRSDTTAQVYDQTWPDTTLFPTQPDSEAQEPSYRVCRLPASATCIEQLLPDRTGCLMVGERSILRLSPQSGSESPADPADPAEMNFPSEQRGEAWGLQTLVEWPEPSLIGIEPRCKWFAALTATPESANALVSNTQADNSLAGNTQADNAQTANTQTANTGVSYRLTTGQLPEQQNHQPARYVDRSLKLSGPLHPQSRLLVLDSRHLALLSPQDREDQPPGTSIQLFTRRGTALGLFCLPLRLKQVVFAADPYQLLAIDEQPETILRIDLKPYRIKRFGVSISPQFLVATDWGYVLASTSGEIAFLDQEGRSIGKLCSPAPLTAMTVVGPGLLIATETSTPKTSTSETGTVDQLLSFDLRTIGLDLVF